MAEFVLGTGRQRSLRNVVRLVERQLATTQGQPLKIRGHTDNVELLAERSEYQGSFQKYTVLLRNGTADMPKLEEVVREFGEACEVVENEGAVRVTCPGSDIQTHERTAEAVDRMSQCIDMPEVWRVTGEDYRIDPISIELLFQALVKYKASDVHLSPGACPVFRIDGETHNSELFGALSALQINEMVREIAPSDAWGEFAQYKQTSFNYHQIGLGYARVSAFLKNGAPHCTFRFLPETIPSFDDLHIPRATMEKLAQTPRGLVLITGMTGSGKTTTVAALVDYINAHRSCHILCIENPIEYVHKDKKSIISQRSLGADVDTFDDAVTGALRHDPDVIIIGEMRDPDTIRSAINAAATGHLVISTLHSNTASEIVNRVVSFFDPVERDLVKLQLRDCLQCVICQRLVPKVGGGRLPALEIMFKDIKAISDGIIDGNTDLIRVGMQQSVSHSTVFEQFLYTMFKEGKISLEHAREYATDQSVFDQLHMGTYSIPRLDSIKNKGDHEMFKA